MFLHALTCYFLYLYFYYFFIPYLSSLQLQTWLCHSFYSICGSVQAFLLLYNMIHLVCRFFRYPTILYMLYLFPVISFCIVFRMLIYYCSSFSYCPLFFLKPPVLAAAPDRLCNYLHSYLLLLIPAFLYFVCYLYFIRYLYFLISIKTFTIHHPIVS